MTTPFYRGTVDFAGDDPGWDDWYPTVPGRFFLGKPGNMVELPSPFADGYTVLLDDGGVAHGMAGGGTSMDRFGDAARSWTLPYLRVLGRRWQVLNGFKRRAFGAGPWCFLAPEESNRLTLKQSLCGALNGAVEGWATGSGTVTYDATLTSPIEPCGVMRWHGAVNGSRLIAGKWSGSNPAADLAYCTPYVPGLPWAGGGYLSTASGTATVNLRLYGFAADGATVVTSVDAGSLTLTTTPQQAYLELVEGQLGASAIIALAFRCTTAGAPDILISCPWLTERVADVTDWSQGGGTPRVVWTREDVHALGWHMGRDLTVPLAEAYPGAA